MKYKESTLTGSTYWRADRVIIEHPVNGTPLVIYHEREMFVTEDGAFPTPRMPQEIVAAVDLAGSVALRDLQTGELTGESVPNALLYQALFSDYLNRALERDAQS